MDNQFVKVSRELLDNLIDAAQEACSILNSQCSDLDVYEALDIALENMEYEVISDECYCL